MEESRLSEEQIIAVLKARRGPAFATRTRLCAIPVVARDATTGMEQRIASRLAQLQTSFVPTMIIWPLARSKRLIGLS